MLIFYDYAIIIYIFALVLTNKTIIMKSKILNFIFMLVLIGVALTCRKEGDTESPVVKPGVEEPFREVILRYQIVTIVIDNNNLPQNEFQGKFGNQNIVLKKSDDNKLLFSVPYDTTLGFVDLMIPSLNNLLIKYEVKNTVLTETPDVALSPLFTKINNIALGDTADDIALKASIDSFNKVYQNLTASEKTEMAIIYKANTNLINSIFSPNGTVSGKNSDSPTTLKGAILKHKVAVLGIATGAVIIDVATPNVKILGAILAGVSTGYAVKFFFEVLDIAEIKYNLIVNAIMGTNDKIATEAAIILESDIEKSVSLNAKSRSVISTDSKSTQSDIASFFKYTAKYNDFINGINTQIRWINKNVVFANFSLIDLKEVPSTSKEVSTAVSAADFSKMSFNTKHNNLQLVSSSLKADGQLNLKIKVIDDPAVLPIESALNYSYTDEFNSFSGSIPIKVNAKIDCSKSTLAIKTTTNSNSASVSVTGGKAPYTYLWSNGAITSTVNNLANGKYSVTVTDAAGCIKTENVTVAFSCTTSTLAIATTINVKNASVNVTGGKAPYTYMWSNGSTGSSVTNLANGTYTVKVTDSLGCSKTATVTINFSCSTSTLALSITKTNNSASAKATGGQSPYIYLWNNGANTATVNNLSLGVYSLTVTDALGCSKSGNVTIESTSEKVTDIDGNVYPTVKIGNQTWMQTNLNVSKYRNGDTIPQVTDPEKWKAMTTGAWCYYQNNTANGVVYGKLYNWHAINDSRGLAPQGYHVPSDAEWNILTTFIGEADASVKMRSTSGWGSLTATNTSGFTGLPGGNRNYGMFEGQGNNSYFWTSSSVINNNNFGIDRVITPNESRLFKGSQFKYDGLYIRCVKN